MSNLIWTPPNYLAWSVFKSPEFSTIVQQAASGKTTRSPLYANPIWNYKLTWELLRGNDGPPSSLNQLMDWFNARQGSFDTFLYSDPSDNSVTGQLLGYGDGSNKVFQLSRQLASGLLESIQNPGVVSAVKVAGSPLSAFGYYIGTENLLLQSQTFDQSVWAKTATTVTANTTAAPDATTTADTFAPTSASDSFVNQLFWSNIPHVPNGMQLTFSVWLRTISGTLNGLKIFIIDGNGNSTSATCNLTTSWQRFSVTRTMFPGAWPNAVVQIGGGGTFINTGASIAVWGAQLERFPTFSGYLPTTSAITIPLGQVSLASAPTAGQAVTADFSFYQRLRFKNDIQEFEEFYSNYWNAQTVELVSERA